MLNILRSILRKIGHQLSIYLTKPRKGPEELATSDPELLVRCLQPGHVLLIVTNSRVGGVIKFLTQSGWSHGELNFFRIVTALILSYAARVRKSDHYIPKA